MMKKPKTSRKGLIKIAMLIPAVLITLGLTTGMTPQQKPVTGKVVFAESGENAAGATVLISATSMGTVVDHDGTFKLNVDGDPEIVVSFVGYKTLRIRSSKIGKKPLKLESEAFSLDLENVPLKVVKEGDNAISIRMTDGSGKQPVFVLDGKVVETIDNIDPNTINSIDVIKNPNSDIAKKYNAKDGVILITSKEAEVILTPRQVKSVLDEKDNPQGSEPVFYIVEDMPMFPGGKAALKTYIYSNLEYPESKLNNGVSGEVMVQFLVTTSGKIEDISVARSTDEAFNKPAMKVFKNMPDWKPGSQRGKPVKVQVVVPVRFNADEG